MNVLLIMSSIAFLISFGSWTSFETSKRGIQVPFENTATGGCILALIAPLSHIMLNLSLNKLINFKWYWVFLISAILMATFAHVLSAIYSSIFGVKISPLLPFEKKASVFIADAFITFIIGIVLYFMAG